MEKMPPDQQENVDRMTEVPPSKQYSDTVKEVTEMLYEELPLMPEKSAFMFHHNI